MIKLFTLNVSENILNKFKDVEIHAYKDNICIPVAFIYEDEELLYEIIGADYDRISASIFELRGRKKSSRDSKS